jgi:molybdenum cofactor guanylyltransferase
VRASCDAAAVLCGGTSRRAGLDKQTLPLGDATLPVALARLLGEIFPQVLIVTNKPRLYALSGFPAVEDIVKGAGPLGGIHAALLRSASEYVYVLGGDMPYPNPEYIERLREAAALGAYDAIATRLDDGHIEPLNSFFSRRCAAPIEERLARGELGVGAFLRSRREVLFLGEAEARRYSPDWRMFASLNTGEDVAAFLGEGRGAGPIAPPCASLAAARSR